MAIKPKLLPATQEQQSVIAQLYELYTYEMTDLADFDIGSDGFYRYPDLPLFWTMPDRFPYLIWVDDKLAGFALFQKGSPIDDNPEIWDIAEFFIMRKFRNQGIGKYVAALIWNTHPGTWQIRVWDNNTIACQFWENALCTGQKFEVAH